MTRWTAALKPTAAKTAGMEPLAEQIMPCGVQLMSTGLSET